MADVDRERARVDFLVTAAHRHQEYSRLYLPRLFGNDRALQQLTLQAQGRGPALLRLSFGTGKNPATAQPSFKSLDQGRGLVPCLQQ